MRCSSCGLENASGIKFCGEWGNRSVRLRNQHHHRTSPYTPKHLAEKILTSRSALEGERKQVTVLFANAKGRTRRRRAPAMALQSVRHD
jgi:hypothetical protein